MNEATIIAAIRKVLTEVLTIPNITAFHPNARLNEDLYLDSVLLMELLINLETELAIEIPDSALNKEDFVTVHSLARFLSNSTSVTLNSEPPPEEFDDIKVHCFVSCLCEPVKADTSLDHRPFYFGVWDAEIVIDEFNQLTYHSDSINHDFFRQWYKRLYGATVHAWYKPEHSKAENIDHLQTLLAQKPNDVQVMVMLDMFRLPERENKFNQNPFPHYVLLERTEDPAELYMSDPDFRWEGRMKTERVLHAIASPAVAGGFQFDRRELRPSNNEDIKAYFLNCFNENHHPLTEAVATVVKAHTTGCRPVKALSDALRHLPVLAIRKYAFEHGFAFFWRAMGQMAEQEGEFEHWCQHIEDLVATYKQIQFRCMKLAKPTMSLQLDEALLAEVHALMMQQHKRETAIKQRLYTLFEQWTHFTRQADV